MVEQQPSISEGTLDRLRTAQRDLREEYLAPNTDPWIIGYSGGKDSIRHQCGCSGGVRTE